MSEYIQKKLDNPTAPEIAAFIEDGWEPLGYMPGTNLFRMQKLRSRHRAHRKKHPVRPRNTLVRTATSDTGPGALRGEALAAAEPEPREAPPARMVVLFALIAIMLVLVATFLIT